MSVIMVSYTINRTTHLMKGKKNEDLQTTVSGPDGIVRVLRGVCIPW